MLRFMLLRPSLPGSSHVMGGDRVTDNPTMSNMLRSDMAAESDNSELQQRWPLPSAPKPIVLIGAGGIVNDAHLPAYAACGFTVAAIFDIVRERSGKTAAAFGIPVVCRTLAEAVGQGDVIYDIAVPPQALHSTLEHLPEGAVVLMQKPMGQDLDDARRIAELCEARNLTAAVNFQLRVSPMMLALRDAVRRGWIGDIVDVEVHLNYLEPWAFFPFLKTQPRVEMTIASIHYFDWIRSLLGEPLGVYARSIPHPEYQGIETTRTSAILDYGIGTRCCLSLNNTWAFGGRHEATAIRVEGLRGAAVVRLGGLVNYPDGADDTLEIAHRPADGEAVVWRPVPLVGNWFPDAFRGTMSNLQRFAAGEDDALMSPYQDAVRTMALIEACYQSNDRGSTAVP